MTDRPILFSRPMINAILEGRKTQTRRVLHPQPCNPECPGTCPVWGWGEDDTGLFRLHASFRSRLGKREDDFLPCPYGKSGDRLWVRETFAAGYGKWHYAADYFHGCTTISGMRVPWKPSIFMPREASRITLEVVEVRVQRVQEISEGDAVAEGCDGLGPEHYSEFSAIDEYRNLWDSLNAKRGFTWASNPWVWAITFKKL